MIKISAVLCGLFISTSALAASPLFFGGDGHDGHGDNSYLKCMRAGWMAANPSDEQNQAALAEMQKMKDVEEEHRTALGKAKKAMFYAIMKHPISKEEVNAASAEVHSHSVPIKVAARDSGINIINLLSAEQRKNFDHAYMNCMHHN